MEFPQIHVILCNDINVDLHGLLFVYIPFFAGGGGDGLINSVINVIYQILLEIFII